MALDPGWAAIFGVVAGAFVSVASGVATSVLTAWINGRRARSLAEKRRDRLRGMLSGEKYKWRSLEQLSASIGADEATTTELLIEIDARASFTNAKSWALVSRAPWPEDVQPKR